MISRGWMKLYCLSSCSKVVSCSRQQLFQFARAGMDACIQFVKDAFFARQEVNPD
ncbi:hypothetical protein ULF88_06285 [Halopseudomonas pachastrellae]|nr:hypothetical protein [Halopseudomonas pachastrellae]